MIQTGLGDRINSFKLREKQRWATKTECITRLFFFAIPQKKPYYCLDFVANGL